MQREPKNRLSKRQPESFEPRTGAQSASAGEARVSEGLDLESILEKNPELAGIPPEVILREGGYDTDTAGGCG